MIKSNKVKEGKVYEVRLATSYNIFKAKVIKIEGNRIEMVVQNRLMFRMFEENVTHLNTVEFIRVSKFN
jgi:hypothetical protein